MDTRFLLPCLLFQLSFYALLRFLFPERKKRAWILTLAVSTLFGILVGPLYVYRFALALFSSTPAASIGRMLAVESWLDALSASFMVVFLALDLTIGQIDYREFIQFDTGYIHHAVYLPIYLTMLYFRLTPLLLLGACCELPTFIMALGILFPSLRQDLGFGVTFFFTRIVWFVVLLLVYLHPVCNPSVRGPGWPPLGPLCAAPRLAPHPLSLLTLPLHFPAVDRNLFSSAHYRCAAAAPVVVQQVAQVRRLQQEARPLSQGLRRGRQADKLADNNQPK